MAIASTVVPILPPQPPQGNNAPVNPLNLILDASATFWTGNPADHDNIKVFVSPFPKITISIRKDSRPYWGLRITNLDSFPFAGLNFVLGNRGIWRYTSLNPDTGDWYWGSQVITPNQEAQNEYFMFDLASLSSIAEYPVNGFQGFAALLYEKILAVGALPVRCVYLTKFKFKDNRNFNVSAKVRYDEIDLAPVGPGGPGATRGAIIIP